MKTRRYVTLAGLALGPVLVLAVFFVLPVSGMLGQGFCRRRQLRPRRRCSRCWPGRGPTGSLVHGLVGRAGDGRARVLLGLPAAYVLHRLAFPAAASIRALLLVPFVLPTVVVGVAFRLLLGEAGPLGFLGPGRDAGRRSSPASPSSTSRS